MKKIKLLIKGTLAEKKEHGNCRECQTPCKSACKTSCTVGNQHCEQQREKATEWMF
jgi:predicted ribosomally synthesized six-cysteine peptide SCIFF